MAYVASGSQPQIFMRALHQAVSALGSQLFKVSFKLDQSEDSEVAQRSQRGALPGDFLNVRVPDEERFSGRLLASRLQKYKLFKLEQLISDLKHGPHRAQQTQIGLSPESTPVQVASVEEEIDRMNESFLQLSLQLQRSGQTHTQRPDSQHTPTHYTARAGPGGEELPALGRDGTVLLELKRRYVSQRLDELQITLEQQSRPRQPQDAAKEKNHVAAAVGDIAQQGPGKHDPVGPNDDKDDHHHDDGALSECRAQDTPLTGHT
ncbi:hypothetical protein CRUP_025393 [Coryphaenoides rupestris]|nr:hypothetical protein CRUP_025393 [Coryphaenoides rupestris]